jgi:hypothetical protein
MTDPILIVSSCSELEDHEAVCVVGGVSWRTALDIASFFISPAFAVLHFGVKAGQREAASESR